MNARKGRRRLMPRNFAVRLVRPVALFAGPAKVLNGLSEILALPSQKIVLELPISLASTQRADSEYIYM